MMVDSPPWSLVWILRTAIDGVFPTFRSDVRTRSATSVPPSVSGRSGSRSGTDRGAARRSFPGSSGERLVDDGGDPRSAVGRAKAVSKRSTVTAPSMGRISSPPRAPGARFRRVSIHGNDRCTPGPWTSRSRYRLRGGNFDDCPNGGLPISMRIFGVWLPNSAPMTSRGGRG